MYKRSRSDLRTPRALRLEMFEDRCLLSGVSSLLTAPLLSPPFLLPAPVTTAVLTRLAPPAVSSLVVTGSTTVINALNGAGTAVAGLTLNAGLTANPGPVVAPILSNGLTNIAPTLGAIASVGLGNTPAGNFQILIGAQVTRTAIVSSVNVRLGSGTDVKLTNTGGGQLGIGPASVPVPALDIGPASIVTAGAGESGTLSVGLKVDAELAPIASLNDVPEIRVGGSQGFPYQANVALGLGDASLPLDSGADVGLRDREASAGGADTEMLVQIINELSRDIAPEFTSLIPPADLAGQAEAGRQSSTDGPAVSNQVVTEGGTSDVDDVAWIPSPQTEGGLADLLPMDLASLEADLKAFLAQIEELGGELSSLLGRTNLSPWLMAIAVAAITGEVARRLQRPQRRLLAAGDGATLAWFPDLSGPWSPREL
jgi:hypothetical protein